jgi:hypothetical protein
MASYIYEYSSDGTKHPALTPVSEKEYKLIRNDVDQFIENIVKKAEPQFAKRKNPYRFRWKLFLILLISGILLITIEFTLKGMGYADAADIFDVLSYAPFFTIILQPAAWVVYWFNSPSVYTYEKEATAYYHFHSAKANEAKNYKDYVRIISEETNIGEYYSEDVMGIN